MANASNMRPAVSLVFFGAWSATRRSAAAALITPRVLGLAVACGAIAVAAAAANDYFDFSSGVDVVNAPTKALVEGTMTPQGAALLATTLYCAILSSACYLRDPLLLAIVYATVGVTILYTPVVKRMAWLKNVVIAGLFAATPIAGAIATGAPLTSIQHVAVPAAILFLGAMFREIMLDISDRAGDCFAGVHTLAATAGPGKALSLATGCLLAATAIAVASVSTSAGAASLAAASGLPLALVQALAGAAVVALVAPLLSTVRAVRASKFDMHVSRRAVNACVLPLAGTMAFLTAMAA